MKYISGWWFGTFLFFHILGMSSSQLTNSIIFERGWLKPPTSYDNNVGKTIINHPAVITIFIGGTKNKHSQMGALLCFYPYYET
jgi:hypothetical protein